MQLGTRWEAGAEPPTSVPAALRSAIAEVEQHLPGCEPKGSPSVPRGHWTLTWLEGRPIAELDAGWEVFLTASGEIVARSFED